MSMQYVFQLVLCCLSHWWADPFAEHDLLRREWPPGLAAWPVEDVTGRTSASGSRATVRPAASIIIAILEDFAEAVDVHVPHEDFPDDVSR